MKKKLGEMAEVKKRMEAKERIKVDTIEATIRATTPTRTTVRLDMLHVDK